MSKNKRIGRLKSLESTPVIMSDCCGYGGFFHKVVL